MDLSRENEGNTRDLDHVEDVRVALRQEVLTQADRRDLGAAGTDATENVMIEAKVTTITGSK